MKLHSMDDYMTNGVWDVLSRAKTCITETREIIPVLVYDINGQKHSFPLHYESLVQIGSLVRRGCAGSQAVAGNMGTEFAFMSMLMSERAQNPFLAAVDRARLFHEVGHTLCHLNPWCFYLSMPIKLVTKDIASSDIEEVMKLGPNHPDAVTALMVIGRNPIRSFGIITPVVKDEKSGEISYEKGHIIDSFSGYASMGGLFSNVYRPRLN